MMPVRKIPRNYRHPTGQVSLGDDKSTAFEGTPEKDFVCLIRGDADFFGIESQPLRIDFKTAEGKGSHYTPDYLVTFRAVSARRPMLVEEKSRYELKEKWAEYRPRFKLATRICRERGWVFNIMTGEKIRTPRFDNCCR